MALGLLSLAFVLTPSHPEAAAWLAAVGMLYLVRR